MGDGVAIERLHLLLSLAIERLDLRYRYTTCTCATCGPNLYGACATDALEMCTGMCYRCHRDVYACATDALEMCHRDVDGTCGTDAPYSTRPATHAPHLDVSDS